MRTLFVALSVLPVWVGLASADHPSTQRKAILLDGLGDVHHLVTTSKPRAQLFFDQGLALIYAFNHDEAVRSFQRAAEIDPKMAMAYWGIALALGPNYNLAQMPEVRPILHAALDQANSLVVDAPEVERDYINALAQRYSKDEKADGKKLAKAYAAAMKNLARRYPDDLDAATLCAESLMNLRPWELWDKEGKPAAGTQEILEILESVLARNPNHTGANHYYIHAIEASQHPERGLASAHRLEKLAPNAGHLVHMPSHIYIRVGDYESAAAANVKATRADREYIERFKVTGIYPMMYYSHNIHFRAVSCAMQGRASDALAAADELAKHVSPHLNDMPVLEMFVTPAVLLRVKFHLWDDVIKMKKPASKLTAANGCWRFARGCALTARGKFDDAAQELEELKKLTAAVPADTPLSDRNKAKAILQIAEEMLAGKLAAATGKNLKATLHLRAAVAAEDELNYVEPQDWLLPAREWLGAHMLRDGRPVYAASIFRLDLKRNPNNPWSLLGLKVCLAKQGDDYAAQLIDQRLKAASAKAEPNVVVLE